MTKETTNENIVKLFKEVIKDKNENDFDDRLLNFVDKTSPDKWVKEHTWYYLPTKLPLEFIIEQFGGVSFQLWFRPIYLGGKHKGEQVCIGSFSFEKCPTYHLVENAYLIVGEAICRYYFSKLSEKDG